MKSPRYSTASESNACTVSCWTWGYQAISWPIATEVSVSRRTAHWTCDLIPNEANLPGACLRRLSAEHLAKIIYEYGEERHSRRIAQRIVDRRRHNPIRTARQLAELVRACVPRSKRHQIDPATRTFQALRIAVNRELTHLERALHRLPDRLATGGRLAIISFHSLEDRPVKCAFRDDDRLRVLTRKPIRAGDAEVQRNLRSSSARLRVAERVATEEPRPVDDDARQGARWQA